MNVILTKRTIKGLPPKHSVLLRGPHGIGKSEVLKQIALELSESTGKTYGFIDIRLSQREPGDVIGMPRSLAEYPFTRAVFKNGQVTEETSVLKNVMTHDLPVWFPRDPDSCGFILLDELDRASREVQQTAFEISLDYRLNLNPLPAGWRVVSACNADLDIYAVIDIDHALLSRFLVIDFKPTVPEWMDHARKIGVHPSVIQYLTKVPTDLDSPENMEPGKVYPCRRSWVMLSDCINYMAENGDSPIKDLDYLSLLSNGYIGSTAVDYVEFVRKDYDVLTADDILNKFDDRAVKILSKDNPAEITFYNDILVRYIMGMTKLSPRQSENLFRYIQTIPRETAGGFWADFLKNARPLATKWSSGAKERGEFLFSLIEKKE